jgi:hypothetical protein
MSPARPTPTFLGYLAKRVVVRPRWLDVPAVEGVCSVSECISKGAERDYQSWRFNASGFYDSPALAAADIKSDPDQYTQFAYELFPLEFKAGGTHSIPVAEILLSDPALLPTGPGAAYRFLGYDAVSGRRAVPARDGFAPCMAGFDCSPLSCNSEAGNHAVNAYCLLNAWDAAIEAATGFSREEPEPGPYYLFGVYATGDLNFSPTT